MSECKFELGDHVGEKLQQNRGHVVARAEYLGGSPRYLVATEMRIPDGRRAFDDEWYDEGRLEKIEKTAT